MKYLSPSNYEYEDGEPYLRTCPECNGFHKHLWKTNRVHICFSCGKVWLLKKYISEMSEDELDAFLLKNKKNLEKPHNTSPVIMCFKVRKT